MRKAVASCRRLVVLVTEETATSRWLPWETGLADGVAGSEQVALLPLRPSATASDLWLQQRYFDLYGRIEHVTLRGDSQPCWAVRNPDDGKYWRLQAWIEQTGPRKALR